MKLKIIIVFTLACFLFSCNSIVEKSNNIDSVKTVLQTKKIDSSNYYFKDELRTFYDCDNPKSVIRKTKPVTKQLFIEIKNGESVPIKYFVEEAFGQFDTSSNKGLLDLDDDNIPELLITYYTGGNHCCAGLWIGKKVNDSIYQETFFVEGEMTTMNNQKIFRCGQSERLGYFYTSYSCGGDLKSPYDYSATDLQFKYKNGYPDFISDAKNRTQIIKNLTILSKLPIPALNKSRTEIDCMAFRKNFAQNIVALYFNDQQDAVAVTNLKFANPNHNLIFA